MDLEGLSKKWRENVFRRFGVKGGGIGVGIDADFFLMEEGGGEIRADELLYRHAISAYTSIVQKCKVCGTWLRGERITDETRGRFLRSIG